MPESRNRTKHHRHHPQHVVSADASHITTKRSAAFVLAVVAGILGFIVSYVTQGADLTWLIAGTALGALVGYLLGRSMDKSMEKK